MGKAGQRVQDVMAQGQMKQNAAQAGGDPTMDPCSNGTGSGRPNFSPPQGMMGMMGRMNQGMNGMQSMINNFQNRAAQVRQQMPYERQSMFGMSMKKPKMGASIGAGGNKMAGPTDVGKIGMVVGGLALANKAIKNNKANKEK